MPFFITYYYCISSLHSAILFALTLLLWCCAGKNLYNNEHVAIKLVSFCVLYTDVKLTFCMRVYACVCSSENVNARFQHKLNSLQVRAHILRGFF